jgi:hypothetical protein
MITQCFISRIFSSSCNITSCLLLLHLQLLKLLLEQWWKEPELRSQKKRKNKVTLKKAAKRSPEKSVKMSPNKSAKMSTWTPKKCRKPFANLKNYMDQTWMQMGLIVIKKDPSPDEVPTQQHKPVIS